MGQVTLPVLNRKGVFDVWENSWHSAHSTSTNIAEDEFLSIFFTKFFRNWLSHTHFKSIKLSSTHLEKKIRTRKFFSYSQVLDYSELVKLYRFNKNKKFPYYISRLFIIKYDSWVVLYMYFYVPRSWFKRFFKKKRKLYNYNYIVDLYLFHINKNKLLSNTFC